MACYNFYFSTFHFFAIFLTSFCLLNVKAEIFDVSSFNIAPNNDNSDITTVLQQAWTETCSGTNNRNTVLVPDGTHNLNPVTFSGPCKVPITFQVNGDLTAPSGADIGAGQWVLFTNVQGLTVTGTGTFNGLGETAWSNNTCKIDPHCKSLPASIRFEKVTNSSVQGITSLNSKFFHIVISESKSIEISNVKIQAPGTSPNTDGIHVSGSKGVKIHNSFIGTGDDCVSIVKGSQDVHIYDITCGPGHGISIGSIGKDENEGDVNGIMVERCNITNTENGLRIKTWAPSHPSKIFNISYSNINFNNIDNPIIINQHYCPHKLCQSQGDSSVQISDVKYENIIGSSMHSLSVNFNCSKSNPCQQIVLQGLNILTSGGQATVASCVNSQPEFDGSSVAPTRCG